MELTENDIINFISKIISEEGNLNEEDIKPEDTFFELGLDSISAIYLMELVENEYQITLNPILFWDYPSIQSFSNKIFTDHF
ncbi:MAG TPA: acyl carrier protein [Fulvivirga sp.]|nr:acyl carrier protein [Fulvivirga sp.]